MPGIPGAVVGAQPGKIVPGKQLLFLFALLMLAIAIMMLRPSKQKKALARIFARVIVLVALYMLYINVTAIHF